MEHWQFLIQKQGDRAWQPLESPTLQILAGKYRVLARSHLFNKDVEVRVTHSSIQEVPPKRRIFKRLRRTNADGLMAVIPFTELKPGIWELRCSADLMTDMLGKSWQYSLLIKVSPQEYSSQPNLDSGDEFDNELEVLLTQDDQTEEDIIINQPVSPVWFKGETAEQLLQSLIDLALPNSESLGDEQIFEDRPPISPLSPLKLSLERDTYITAWGKTLTVNGDVELAPTGDLEDEILSITSLNQLQLLIELRSPSESKVFTQVRQPLTNKILPFTFSTAINIPSECESKLILADISLYGAVTDGGEVIFLANQAFTITADVTELLTVSLPKSNPLDLLSESTEIQTQAETKPEQPVSVGLELFNLVKTPNLAQFHSLKSSANKHLPPKIKPVIVLGGVSPELPNLPRIHKNLMAEALKSEGTIKTPAQISPINLEKLVIKQVKTTLPFLKKLKPVPVQEEKPQVHPSDSLEPQLSEVENTSAFLPNYAEYEDESAGFRENAPAQSPTVSNEELITANTPETSPLIKKWMHSQGYLAESINFEAAEDDPHELNDEPLLILNSENPSVEMDAQEDDMEENLAINTSETGETPEEIVRPIQILPTVLSQEIVLDDTYISLSHEDDNQLSAQPEQPLADLSSPRQESLPTPQLFLPNGELLAGTSIKVRLELSAVSSEVVLKLWVEDYQTRGLLDGPHLLKDLRPTPWGNWEAITQLIVPFGCVEIRVGAIALDLNTQQESGKVTVVKTVIPADLPNIELDDLLGM
ncbi:hypothetical protein VB713_03590 [Anabaena cylindrica UHCC 0172]|uniref:hypothetical protein n=1 Tax=Anabaena cylindrica TaxID=1165 RepID=UPI002B211D0B|nr:hypothetical protein [Anabaena cylindrica]MEA5550072.1 hypothetical protein [Anabaena cylindrica UHCC 0172]